MEEEGVCQVYIVYSTQKRVEGLLSEVFESFNTPQYTVGCYLAGHRFLVAWHFSRPLLL